jgi:tellurium resistance protein TerD
VSEDLIKCPKCGSTQITAGDKGFGLGKAAVGGILLGPVGLLGGMLGSKKVMITCLKCGKKWKAGKK